VEETEAGLVWNSCPASQGIPKTAVRSANGSPLAAGTLKSWAKYTKKERRETIDRLINTMIQCGVNSKKFDEILEGMRSDVYETAK
jgi:phytoene/squalene synthetase